MHTARCLSALLALLALVAGSATAQTGYHPQPPLAPLYSANHAGFTDNFYTIDAGTRAIVLGMGYADTGILAYVERTPQPNTRPFKRFFKGAPQLEHFYTANDDEAAAVMAGGWQYEGIEGYLYTTQVPGSVPLYRAAHYDPATGDLVHKYTLSTYELYLLTAYQGWSSDGLQGYVYTTPTPQVAGGFIVGLRCPDGATERCSGGSGTLPNWRDYYFGGIRVDATARTGTTQRMRFRLWSPDFFGDTAHLFFSLHGRFSLGSPDVLDICPNQASVGPSCSWHRGLGIILFGRPVVSGSSVPSQVFTEAWWVAGNDGGNMRPPSVGSGALGNNLSYAVDLRVRDDGQISYSITDTATNAIVRADSWNASAHFTAADSPFPSELTGYTVGSANDNHHDFTLYVTDFTVDWLP
jgi:hypothetical protein